MMTPRWGYSKPSPMEGWTNWTQFFLLGEGQGYAVVYGSRAPRTLRFAICKHEKVGTGTPEGHRRGWHPGYCGKCGIDMTYDSGD